MVNWPSKIAILTFAGSSGLLFYPMPLNAQGTSISVFPPIIEVQTSPPSSPLAPIVLRNNNNEDLNLRIELIPFRTNGINGSVQLMPELSAQGFYPYYKGRIQFLENGVKTDAIKLQALESKEISVNINLTKGDPPGDYYYSIVFMNDGTSPQETSASQIPAGIASNLILSIGPKGESIGGIKEFTTSNFKTKGPVDFNLKFHNASKHVLSPTGDIKITNMFGKTVDNITILPQYILAGEDRYLTNEDQASNSATFTQIDKSPTIQWPENFLLGLYKATAKIQLEENGRIIQSSIYFFAFPLYFFFGLAVIIFISISIYLRVKRKI